MEQHPSPEREPSRNQLLMIGAKMMLSGATAVGFGTEAYHSLQTNETFPATIQIAIGTTGLLYGLAQQRKLVKAGRLLRPYQRRDIGE